MDTLMSIQRIESVANSTPLRYQAVVNIDDAIYDGAQFTVEIFASEMRDPNDIVEVKQLIIAKAKIVKSGLQNEQQATTRVKKILPERENLQL